jgi:hypothetical protein
LKEGRRDVQDTTEDRPEDISDPEHRGDNSSIHFHGVNNQPSQSFSQSFHLQGLLLVSTQTLTITNPPLKMPAAPVPATTRPRINITELTAVAHIKDPSSKTVRKVRKVHFRLKYW